MSTITLLIQFENEPSPEECNIDSGLYKTLIRFAAYLCQNIEVLSHLQGRELEFFTESDRIHPIDVRLSLEDVIKTIGADPLIIRYPLSNTPVHVRYNLSNSKGSVMLPHTTGLWRRLRQEVYKKFEALRDGDPEFYFVHHLDDGKDGDSIEDEFQLNAIVEETPKKQKKRDISLGVKIEGKKAYGDYTLKEVSKLFMKEEWNNIGNAPEFDIESLPQVESEPSDEEYKYLIDSLAKLNSVFCGEIPNEATARCFITIFMECAILFVRRYISQHKQGHHPKDLRLLVEEYLSGTRGYGPIDYLVKYMQLVVMVNEAKHRDFNKGAAQNIVQMHSALEKRTKKRKLDQNEIPFAMYGIVSIGTNWRFLRWTGSLEDPVIEITPDYACKFVGEEEGLKFVLRTIIRILLSAIKDEDQKSDGNTELEETEDDNEVNDNRTGGTEGHESEDDPTEDDERLIRHRSRHEGNAEEDSRATEKGEDCGDGEAGGPARGYGMGMPKGMVKRSRFK